MSAGKYNHARDALLLQQMQAMGALQKVYEGKLASFLAPAWRMQGDANDTFAYVSQALPLFNEPFQRTAVSLGKAFFQQRRAQASQYTGKALREGPVASGEHMAALFAAANPIGPITGAIQTGKNNGEPAKALADVQRLSSQSIADVSRETFIILSEGDEEVKGGWVRRAKATGCAFCKTQIIAQSRGYSLTDQDKFHNFCSCTTDVTFEGEPTFKQPWEEQAERDFDAAVEMIDSGEAGERRLITGSPEWKDQLLNEITQRPRTSDKLLVEAISSNNFEYITPRDFERLHRKGLLDTPTPDNLDQLLKPISKPIDSMSIRDLTAAYKTVTGQRELRN